jgi:hypothetical protein
MQYLYLKVTGELQDHLTCWDALRAALPVGTVSGAPKVHNFFQLFVLFKISSQNKVSYMYCL